MHGIFPDVLFRACCLHEGGRRANSIPSLRSTGAQSENAGRVYIGLINALPHRRYIFYETGPRFLFAVERAEKKIAIMVKRLSPPSPLDFNFFQAIKYKGDE